MAPDTVRDQPQVIRPDIRPAVDLGAAFSAVFSAGPWADGYTTDSRAGPTCLHTARNRPNPALDHPTRDRDLKEPAAASATTPVRAIAVAAATSEEVEMPVAGAISAGEAAATTPAEPSDPRPAYHQSSDELLTPLPESPPDQPGSVTIGSSSGEDVSSAQVLSPLSPE